MNVLKEEMRQRQEQKEPQEKETDIHKEKDKMHTDKEERCTKRGFRRDRRSIQPRMKRYK